MNYTESLAYLDSLGKFGIKLGMERIEALLKELDNPQDKIKTVHVTGTNGKGSVSSMIANILLASNLKVGKFVSPHLVKYNERISINNNDITDDAFALVLTAVKQAADSIVKKGVCEQPTQFEILTAAAFLHFALEEVDYAVIEVGLGGLWDSTNVITPVVSVITNVALDHCDKLGNTIERIAMQKAGIIKDNVPVVTAAVGDDAVGPIRAVSMFKQARLYIYGRAFWGEEKESTMDGPAAPFGARKKKARWTGRPLRCMQATCTAAITKLSCPANIRLPMPAWRLWRRSWFPSRMTALTNWLCISALPIPSGRGVWNALPKNRTLYWTARITPTARKRCARRWINITPIRKEYLLSA